MCSSGGADKNVVVFDKNEEQIVATLKGHTKKVTSVIYHPSQVTFRVSLIPLFLHVYLAQCLNHLTLSRCLPPQTVAFSASPDSTIRVWSITGGNCVQVVRAHDAGVTGLSLHATGDYLLSSSEDQVGFMTHKDTIRYLLFTLVYKLSLNRFPSCLLLLFCHRHVVLGLF